MLSRVNELHWDPGMRRMSNSFRIPSKDPQEDLTEFSFYVFEDDLERSQLVTYAYFPDRKALRRTVGQAAPKTFALPRLQEFKLQLAATTEGGLEQTLFGSGTPETGRLLQLWFQVRFEVQGEIEGSDIRQTRVELETRIFPLHVNRRLHSGWIESP
jgi:hypothetical protein